MSRKQEQINELQILCGLARLCFQTTELIIAGGAPRDILSQVTVKDIDVFVKLPCGETNSHYFSSSCAALAEKINGKLTLRPSNPEYASYFDLADIEFPNSSTIQIIGINDNPIDDVMKYDFGLSQIFITPQGLFMTEKAAEDRTNKTITHTPSTFDKFATNRSKARLCRLRAKYSEWVFLNCERLDEFELTD